MKRFVKTVLLFALIQIVIITILLICVVSENRGDYLCEYNDKIELLEKTPQPRMIFIGGSSVAFGINSKAIMDSLHINVVNFGLHSAIGIKYPIEDCLQYIKRGDIVVIQMEYEHFFDGNGEPEGLLHFMLDTNWRNANSLSTQQWEMIFLGLFRFGTSKLKPFIKYLMGSPNINEEKYNYSKNGFNEYGDEIAHLKIDPSLFNTNHLQTDSLSNSKRMEKKIHSNVNMKFMTWLTNEIQKYEETGAKVIFLPPACITTFYQAMYNNDNYEDALRKIQHPYVVEPSYMLFDDSCMFDTKYHLNAEGVKQNTTRIISIFKNNPQIFVSKSTDR